MNTNGGENNRKTGALVVIDVEALQRRAQAAVDSIRDGARERGVEVSSDAILMGAGTLGMAALLLLLTSWLVPDEPYDGGTQAHAYTGDSVQLQRIPDDEPRGNERASDPWAGGSGGNGGSKMVAVGAFEGAERCAFGDPELTTTVRRTSGFQMLTFWQHNQRDCAH